MKKLYILIAALSVSAMSFAQSPSGMSYQAVVRASDGTLVVDQAVGMQISILSGSSEGAEVYIETQSPTTNANGLLSLEIGTGSTSDNFATVNWSSGNYFIKTETDPTGGSNYTITGTSKLMSVPYALQSKKADNGITIAQASEITVNTLKNGITTAQANEITDNSSKIGYTDALVTANKNVVENTAKKGITTDQAADIDFNTSKIGYAESLVSANSDVFNNTAKIGYTEDLVAANSAVKVNTLKTGITTAQANEITDNSSKIGYTDALVTANKNVVENTAKKGITTDQAADIDFNTSKIGYTESLVSANSDVVKNTSKIGYTEDLVAANSAVKVNSLKTGISTEQVNEIRDNSSKVGYTDALVTANIDVLSNTSKVATINALMDALQDRIAALEPAGPSATVGDFRDGGVVFFVDPNDDRHGLVCAITDQSAAITWDNGAEEITPNADGTTVGTGSANTTAIIAKNGAVETSYAAGLARAYSGGGFNDWFLPSKQELNQMYINKEAIEEKSIEIGGNEFESRSYWSSSEYIDITSWSQNFGNGTQYNDNYKSNTKGVRAVRAF